MVNMDIQKKVFLSTVGRGKMVINKVARENEKLSISYASQSDTR